MTKKVCVYIDLNESPLLVGKLWAHTRNGRESATFEYDNQWLNFSERFSLEPALPLGKGPHHTSGEKVLFGAIGDSAPDRWGRVLMRRAERLAAEREKRTPRSLMEIDYLLMVNDQARQGALRFSLEEGGTFLADDNHRKIPPLVELPKLLNACERVTDDSATEEDLKLLLAPGSSLGGARPKASVLDNGHLAVAKFPNQLDETNIVLWEALALTLAKQAQISVPLFRIEKVADRAVLISRRFDRLKKKRIPFLSAMSMLGAGDNEMHSYLEMVDALRNHGSHPNEDIKELWRRIVFNILISNTDDHLRNHGFLYDGAGWRLSPAYDLNPVPLDIKPHILSTSISIDDPTASIDLALSVADYFDLTAMAAKDIIAQVSKAVIQWRTVAKQFSIPNAQIERMASAFPVFNG
jgi:serine/threonine-protein kinase HipA